MWPTSAPLRGQLSASPSFQNHWPRWRHAVFGCIGRTSARYFLSTQSSIANLTSKGFPNSLRTAAHTSPAVAPLDTHSPGSHSAPPAPIIPAAPPPASYLQAFSCPIYGQPMRRLHTIQAFDRVSTSQPTSSGHCPPDVVHSDSLFSPFPLSISDAVHLRSIPGSVFPQAQSPMKSSSPYLSKIDSSDLFSCIISYIGIDSRNFLG